MSNQNLLAFYLKEGEVQSLSPVGGSEALPLPLSLVVPPGNYSVLGQAYAMQTEGLYRFINPAAENRQCIVFRNEVFALMSAISWLVSHGYRDNEKSFEELKALACKGKLIVTCGTCSTFAVQLFQEVGLAARCVQTLSLRDRNGYNDGHVLTEVRVDDKWIVFDPDCGALYSNDGQLLNIMQLTRQARSGEFQRHPLTAGVPMAIGHFTSADYAYDLWYETALSTETLRLQTFQRAVQVPMMVEEETCYFTAFSDTERQRIIELYPEMELNFLSPDEFYKRYYPLNQQDC